MTVDVTVTERAARRIGEILGREPAGTMLRVSVEGGGCSGFQYKFDTERQRADDDIVIERSGATVLIDPVSLNYMTGSEIDYVDDLIGSSFKVNNPKATAACNAKHSISQRLCSWLLRVHDEVGDGELQITQEMLAKMLGVQRASVSMFASKLQEDGLVRYRRGRLQITDADGLEVNACECHKAVREQFGRLFGTTKSAAQRPPASVETTAPHE